MVSRLALFLLSSLGFAVTAYADVRRTQSRHITLPRRSTEFTTIPEAEFSVPLTAKAPRRQVKKDMLASLRGKSATTVLAGSDFDEEYLLNVTIGGQQFAMILDTGSSDTWLAEVNFTCINLASQVQPESECAFGPLFTTTSSTFSTLPNLNFNITYGDSEFLLGTVANESVTVAGVKVMQQEIGVVYRAAWFGDGISSGLLGLAYPGLTSVYAGDNPDTDAFPATSKPYDPFFFSAVREGVVSAPFFSVALDRGTFNAEENDPFDPNLGFLALGGLAPVPVTNTAVTVPVQGYQVSDFTPSNASSATDFFYTVDVQALTFPGSGKLHTFNNNTILDTGTTLNYIPTDAIAAFARAFDPPAVFNDDEDAYIVKCNAKVPEFLVTIGGTTFSVDARDQILPVGTDAAGNIICILGTQDGGPNENGNIFILGDTFLHNVVATFNIQSNELTITQRQTY